MHTVTLTELHYDNGIVLHNCDYNDFILTELPCIILREIQYILTELKEQNYVIFCYPTLIVHAYVLVSSKPPGFLV